jgi:hypothetical protein
MIPELAGSPVSSTSLQPSYSQGDSGTVNCDKRLGGLEVGSFFGAALKLFPVEQ